MPDPKHKSSFVFLIAGGVLFLLLTLIVLTTVPIKDCECVKPHGTLARILWESGRRIGEPPLYKTRTFCKVCMDDGRTPVLVLGRVDPEWPSR